MNAVERHYLRTTALVIAAEGWASQYERDPTTHAQLIKTEASWQLALSKMFKGFANNAANFINIGAYYSQVTADYNIEVILNELAFDEADNTFIKVSLQPVTKLIGTGAAAGQNIYKIPLGLSPASARIQHLGTSQVAGLVGKKVNPDGSIVDNPSAAYNITDTMRNDIVASIKRSLALGENTDMAVERLQEIIGDPFRAERIARTESVNAYQSGLSEFADASNAVGKEWQDAGAVDECASNTEAGPIPIDDSFPSGDSEPTAHPGCRCGIRYIYQSEWGDLGL